MTNEVLTSIGNGLLYASSIMLFVVIVYYHLTARWWATGEGRHIMAWTAVTWAIMAYLTAYALGWFHTDVRLGLRCLIFAAFLWLAIWRFVLIARAQRLGQAAGRDPDEPAIHVTIHGDEGFVKSNAELNDQDQPPHPSLGPTT